MPAGSVRFRRRSDQLWLLGMFALLALLLVNTWRDAISERLVPDARLNRNLERAQKQLQLGVLSRADGSGARELFESVLATDPDQNLARAGLLAVRNAALARAAADLRGHRVESARADLELAQALSAPQPQVQPLWARLRVLEEASVDVPALLARAAAPGVGDDEALALLDQVLALDAGNALALDGRRELFAQSLLQAEHELDAGKLERARARIERVIADDPGHVDLPPLRARLGELDARLAKEGARAQAGRERAARLHPGPPAPALAPQAPATRALQQRATQHSVTCFEREMAAGRLLRAQTCMEAWQAQQPVGAEVAAARRRLAERWLAYGDERIGASDWIEADRALEAAARWQPRHPQLPAAQARLRRARGGAH